MQMVQLNIGKSSLQPIYSVCHARSHGFEPWAKFWSEFIAEFRGHKSEGFIFHEKYF